MRGGKILIFAGVLLTFTVSVHADIIIDNFDANQSLVANSSTPVAQSSVSDAGILGGERDTRALYQSGPGNVVLEANLGGDKILNFSLAAKTSGGADIVWDGLDGSSALNYTGLGSVDLSDGGVLDRIAIMLGFDDLPVTLVLEVWTNSDYMSVAQLNLPGGIFSPVEYELPFTSFVDSGSSGPADFTNVGMIVLEIDVQFPSTDLQIDYVKSTPEPVTLCLLALGSLAMLRRKRK